MAMLRRLPVKLTNEELLDRSKSLTTELDKKDALTAKKKSEAEKIAGDIALVEEGIQALRKALRDGEEERDVECHVHRDFDNHTVVTIRNDTGEIIEERPMTQAELQTSLLDRGAEQHGKLLAINGDKPKGDEEKDKPKN